MAGRTPGPPPAVAGAALFTALGLNYKVNAYADQNAALAPPSPDLMFRLLPHIDLRLLYLWGPALFFVFLIWHVLRREKGRAAYAAWLYSLLLALRAAVVLLTPLRLPADSLPVAGMPFFDLFERYFTAHNDLFFSLHTAMPFLAFLVFKDKLFRNVCLGFSIVMGATVLLSRLHYSMDVAAAYPFTYALFRWEEGWVEPLWKKLS